MGIHENCTQFAGYKVVDFDPPAGIPSGDIICRLKSRQGMPHLSQGVGCLLALFGGARKRRSTKAPTPNLLESFIELPGASEIPGLVIGACDTFPSDQNQVVVSMVASKAQFPKLRALFLHDTIMEECEISWLEVGDIGPLFEAYPCLEHLKVRGCTFLNKPVMHDKLQSLVFESGGLPGSLVRTVLASKLPNLEHLEFWFGDENYGGDAKLEDLGPLFEGNQFLNLKRLGLRSAEFADEIAQSVVASKVIEHIEELDLSLGTLSDTGAWAIFECPYVSKLKNLDLHHNYISPELVEALESLPLNVDARKSGDECDDDELGRFISVSE